MKYCEFCEENHLEKVKEMREITLKGIKVEYEAEYGYCPELDEYLEDDVLINENLRRARDAYRLKVGMLTTEKLVEIRTKLGVSQKDFATILGMGEATISRIETKVIQDRTTDDAIRRVNEDPVFFLEKLEGVRVKLGEKKYNKIKEKIDLRKKMCTYFDKIVELEYFDLRDGNDYNGFNTLNLIKIINMIIYFAKNCNRVYKTKLNKLMWYADFLNFKENKKSISGLAYSHFPFGAVPMGMDELLKCLDGIKLKEWEDRFTGLVGTEIEAASEFDSSIFTKDEVDTLGRVAAKFKDFSSREISDYMHDETAYKETGDRELISYSHSEQLRPF